MVTDNEPLLNITKSISPVPVTENGTLTYTFLIQNTGNTAADAATAAEIIDTFDPILSNIAVSYNGTALAAGTDYTYNEATGLFATTAGRITVPAAVYTQDPATGNWIVTPGAGNLNRGREQSDHNAYKEQFHSITGERKGFLQNKRKTLS